MLLVLSPPSWWSVTWSDAGVGDTVYAGRGNAPLPDSGRAPAVRQHIAHLGLLASAHLARGPVFLGRPAGLEEDVSSRCVSALITDGDTIALQLACPGSSDKKVRVMATSPRRSVTAPVPLTAPGHGAV